MATSWLSFHLRRRFCVLPLLLCLTFALPHPVSSSPCTSDQSFSKSGRIYSHCADLPTLSASLHWTLHPSNSSLSVAFVAPPAKPDGWVAWAINPSAATMVGAQSLIAFRQSDGSTAVKTFNISSYGPIAPSPISYPVSDMEARVADGKMMIFADVTLPAGTAKINQVWQVGSSVAGSIPAMHDFAADNLASAGTLDLKQGQTTGSSASVMDSKIRKRNIHGVLNAVSWGILMPIGVIIARYSRTFPSADPAWFYLHVSCQFSGYVVGVAGWATGMILGRESKEIRHSTHRNIGITLFSLATLQVMAMLLRPKKEQKWRVYWNLYHRCVGYSLIVLGIVNVFKGLEVLDPSKQWRTAYIVVLAVLGGVAVVLEVLTWAVVLRRRKAGESTTKLQDDGSFVFAQNI